VVMYAAFTCELYSRMSFVASRNGARWLLQT
jgi:hypothetical protein